MILLFDVDGTLTPSRGTMDTEFKRFFMQLPNFSLVTGSDVDKTIEQVGQDVFEKADYCFNCSGSDVYINGQALSRNNWSAHPTLMLYLKQQIENSPYGHRFGNHIEERPGMLNFSIVGRNAVGDQRTHYYEWDKTAKEHQRIAQEIVNQFPDISATVGGETGIDVAPNGSDKSQVLKYLNGSPVHFFGDRCEPGGNDYSIAKRLVTREDCQVSHVSDWNHTWEILKAH